MTTYCVLGLPCSFPPAGNITLHHRPLWIVADLGTWRPDVVWVDRLVTTAVSSQSRCTSALSLSNQPPTAVMEWVGTYIATQFTR